MESERIGENEVWSPKGSLPFGATCNEVRCDLEGIGVGESRSQSGPPASSPSSRACGPPAHPPPARVVVCDLSA